MHGMKDVLIGLEPTGIIGGSLPILQKTKVMRFGLYGLRP